MFTNERVGLGQLGLPASRHHKLRRNVLHNNLHGYRTRLYFLVSHSLNNCLRLVQQELLLR